MSIYNTPIIKLFLIKPINFNEDHMALGKKSSDAKQFVVTKELRTQLKDMVRTGNKAVVVKAQQAIIDAQNTGVIPLAVTNHGE